MTFAWPLALSVLVAVPLVLGVYLVAMRRRRKQAVSYSSVALLRSVLPRRSRWRRHLPLATLLASLGMLGVASARPQMVQNVPTARTSIILALDVSRSMCATDVDPNRLVAAQEAARGFVEDLPEGARLGLVVFSGYAQLAVAPTTDRQLLTNAIDALTTGRGTAIGAAMLKSLDAIAEVNAEVRPVGDVVGGGLPGAVPPPPPAAKPGSAGFVPDIVVLLTDGANTRGIRPLEAVPYAVERRVRVYTIGFGTTRPTALSCSAQQLNGDTQRFGGGGGFGGGFGGGGGARSPLLADDDTLRAVAEQTGGTAYKAEDAAQLRKVFADLPKDVTVQKRPREVTAPFVAIGALLAAVAMGASIRWSAYP
ncbi:MAG TPA: VWA domain-containing protein [Acidimicrobiales bacterium]|nr:VWA domain-containing protein [Acidimicrobiales bacterium]